MRSIKMQLLLQRWVRQLVRKKRGDLASIINIIRVAEKEGKVQAIGRILNAHCEVDRRGHICAFFE